MDFADDLVIDYPLTFCNFLEGEFAANVFRFGSHSCLWFNQVWLILTLNLTLTLNLIKFLHTVSNFSFWLLLVSPTLVVA